MRDVTDEPMELLRRSHSSSSLIGNGRTRSSPSPRNRRLGLGHKMISNRRMMERQSSKRRMEATRSAEDEPTSPTKKIVKIARRRVHFELDEKKRIKKHIRKIENCKYFDEGDIEVRWWSKDELNGILEREQNVFEVVSNCFASYIDNILRLWEQCKSTPDRVVLLSRDDCVKIADAPARGMESDVVSIHVTGCREKAIKSVIETQRNMSRANAKIRANTMSRRYKHLSNSAAMFARNIAEGDAEVAAGLYQ